MKVKVEIESFSKQLIPASIVPGGWKFTALPAEGEAVEQLISEPFAFFDLPPGLYVFSGQRVSAAGEGIGPQIAQEQEVPSEDVEVDVAAGLRITLGA